MAVDSFGTVSLKTEIQILTRADHLNSFKSFQVFASSDSARHIRGYLSATAAAVSKGALLWNPAGALVCGDLAINKPVTRAIANAQTRSRMQMQLLGMEVPERLVRLISPDRNVVDIVLYLCRDLICFLIKFELIKQALAVTSQFLDYFKKAERC